MASAQPSFGGIKEAKPAPGAVVLRWDRAKPKKSGDKVVYRIYRKTSQGWNFSAPVSEVSTDAWAITGLQAGQPVELLVRAKDSSGEDKNTVTLTAVPTGNFPTQEFRGFWMTRFEWPGGTGEDVRKRLATAMETAAAANMNSVVLQVRGQGDTLYPSAEEPWSGLVSASARSIDPVGVAISEARKNGIQVHAWINLSTIWQSGSKKIPTDKNHPFFRFADSRKPETALGLVRGKDGQYKQWGPDGYVWLTHGHPGVNTYLRRQIVYFLDRYPVHGLHWDDRTAAVQGASYDTESVRRQKGRGNPLGITDMGDWQRDQLSRFLSDVYVTIKAKDPKLLVSASPFGIADRQRIPDYGRFSDAERFGVEPEKWLAMGIVDALMPQVYWDQPDPSPNYFTVVSDWVANNKSGRPIWPGSALGKYGDVQPLDPMQMRYVAMTRSLGLGGNLFYSYTTAKPEQWRALAKSIYPTKAQVPVPIHMTRPHGQIMGTVLDTKQKPIVDAWVTAVPMAGRAAGKPYIYLSSADGFFGIPNLTPGNYKVTFSVREGHSADRIIQVENGKTTRVSVSF